jgi:AraC-like DNA-binding protein
MLAGRRGQIWRYAPEYRRPRHFHSEPELNLVVAGSGSFGSGAEVFPVSAGDLLCWAPGRDHELLEASPDFDLYVAALTPELNARVLCDRNATALAGPLRAKLGARPLAELHALGAAPLASVGADVAERQVAEFWQMAHGWRLAARPEHSMAARALRSLLERPELARDERARLVRGHPTELSRQFHREIGSTLTDYRTRLRLLRFVELADAGHRTLLAAALEAGFGSYSQCHRAFQRAIGFSPRAYFTTGVRRALEDTFEPLDQAG